MIALAVRDVQRDAAMQSAETEAAMVLSCFFMCDTPLQFCLDTADAAP